MSKIYGLEKVNEAVLKSVKCDECGKECKNISIDINLKFAYVDNERLLKTICYGCFAKNYEKELEDMDKKRFNEAMNRSEGLIKGAK